MFVFRDERAWNPIAENYFVSSYPRSIKYIKEYSIV